MASAIRCQRGHNHDDHKMLICDLPVGKVEVPSDGCRFGLKLALVARGVTGKGEKRLCSTAVELLDEFCVGIVAPRCERRFNELEPIDPVTKRQSECRTLARRVDDCLEGGFWGFLGVFSGFRHGSAPGRAARAIPF